MPCKGGNVPCIRRVKQQNASQPHEVPTVFLTLTLSLLALVPLAAQDKPLAVDLPPPPPWATLKAAYNYNDKLLVVVTEKPREHSEHRLSHLSFNNHHGQRVTGLFMRPKAEGRYPCVLLLHGAGGSKDSMLARCGSELAARGIASLALDAARCGERADQPAPESLRRTAGWASRVTLVDYRMALDYLKTRDDVDSKRIGLAGYSMGSQMGAVLAAVDTRIGPVLLCVGGDPIRPYVLSAPDEQKENLEVASPSNFIGYISPRPLLMLNGKEDNNITPDMTKRLWDAAKEPREIRWADCGHALPPEFIRQGLDWLADKLKKP
jgi:uncharacterized protein